MIQLVKNILRPLKKKIIGQFETAQLGLVKFLHEVGININKIHFGYDLEREYESLMRIPGFSTINERRYLLWYAKVIYRNKGEMVELGCTFGSLSYPIIKGISESKHPTCRKLYTYDTFIWHDSFGDILKGTKFHKTVSAGESFLHIYKHYIKEYKSNVNINEGDLFNDTWDNKPIEFLLVDAMKSENLANHILEVFYPSLMVNSTIFHQDFCHFHEPWIHLIQFALREYFTPLGHLDDSSTVIFSLKKKISYESVNEGVWIDTCSNQFIFDAFNYSLSIVHQEPARQNIRSCMIFAFLIKHEFELAYSELDKIKSDYNNFEEGNLIFVDRICNSIKGYEHLIIQKKMNNRINLIDHLDFITDITQSIPITSYFN